MKRSKQYIAKRFACRDCGMNTIMEYYVVHDAVWDSVSKQNEILCVGCLEARLGRRLISADFTHYPINTDYDWMSERLLDRLNNGDGTI